MGLKTKGGVEQDSQEFNYWFFFTIYQLNFQDQISVENSVKVIEIDSNGNSILTLDRLD